MTANAAMFTLVGLGAYLCAAADLTLGHSWHTAAWFFIGTICASCVRRYWDI